ncbi:hypothetical protein NLN82_25770, partial [Citrobacter portucalensis]|uniref:hypothetical protein n=1 Tax=Citrobacter portucalensis TaxID=1639133 RepID=UPI00226B96BC
MTRLVIVGHGMAATRLIEALVMYKNGGISVTVIGEEPQLAYNRIRSGGKYQLIPEQKPFCGGQAAAGGINGQHS